MQRVGVSQNWFFGDHDSLEARPVDVSFMIDPQHSDLSCGFVELIDHSVRPAASGPETLQLASERMTNSFGIRDQRSQHEFDHGGSRLLRKTRESPLGRGSYDELPPRSAHDFCR